jgi:hypothetical protein
MSPFNSSGSGSSRLNITYVPSVSALSRPIIPRPLQSIQSGSITSHSPSMIPQRARNPINHVFNRTSINQWTLVRQYRQEQAPREYIDNTRNPPRVIIDLTGDSD